MKKADKLQIWQERLSRNDSAYSGERDAMDRREAQYRGESKLRKIVRGEKKTETPHVRNLSAELIEAQVDSNIPQPKVTAKRQKDEKLAKIIEDMLRNELDRMPFEEINDIQERTVPIQGGGLYLIEWDNTIKTHDTQGELCISAIHPKQIVPQDGVFTGIEDMDYIILKVPQTKEYIKRRYGISVEDETESEPDVKGSDAEATADDLVTQYIAYYHNDKGGIGLYSWVGDTELEDLEDYQARRLKRCAKCGMSESEAVEALNIPTMDGTYPGESIPDESGEKKCPYCGGTKWIENTEDYEEVFLPIATMSGEIPGATRTEEPQFDDMGQPVLDDMGQQVTVILEKPTRIPFYKPDIYPIILQKNVSVFGKFLGDSDMDKIRDQQNTSNTLETTIIDKLLAGGSFVTLPLLADIKIDPVIGKYLPLENAADKNLIDHIDLSANITQDLSYLSYIYEEARQVIGVTDSFQGRKDSTATSGKAKEFSAAQAAGRLESKRIMKQSAYAKLFEAMFKFKLAYTDEPRPIISHDENGEIVYEEFNKYDFLEQDETGEYYWNDQFLFSCDTSAPLAANREAMWQETRMNLQSGAFGDPTALDTLILFWAKMEQLHYPGAAEVKSRLEQQLKTQQVQAQMQAIMKMQQQAQAQQAQANQTGGTQQIPPELMQAIDRRAQQDAERDVINSARMR